MKIKDKLFWAGVVGIMILPPLITIYIIHRDNIKEGYPVHLKGNPIPLIWY